MKGAVGYMLKDWNKPERPSDEEIDARLKIARENLTRNQIKVKEGKIPVFVIFGAGEPQVREVLSEGSSRIWILDFFRWSR